MISAGRPTKRHAATDWLSRQGDDGDESDNREGRQARRDAQIDERGQRDEDARREVEREALAHWVLPDERREDRGTDWRDDDQRIRTSASDENDHANDDE